MSENDTLRFGGFSSPDQEDVTGEPATGTPDPVIPVEFRVTTYWKRRRNEPGLTRMDSQRLVLSEVLDWVLAELPEEAVAIEHDDTGSNVTIRICWDLVPGEIRYGKRQ